PRRRRKRARLLFELALAIRVFLSRRAHALLSVGPDRVGFLLHSGRRVRQVRALRAVPKVRCARLLPLLLPATVAVCRSEPESRVGVASIRFEGTSQFGAGELSDHIATQETPKFLWFFRASWRRYEDFEPEVLEKDLQRIEHYYERHGYYGTHVRAGR